MADKQERVRPHAERSSAIRSAARTQAAGRMRPEDTMLSARSQSQRDAQCVAPFTQSDRKGRPTQTQSAFAAARASGQGRGRRKPSGRGSPWAGKQALELSGCAWRMQGVLHVGGPGQSQRQARWPCRNAGPGLHRRRHQSVPGQSHLCPLNPPRREDGTQSQGPFRESWVRVKHGISHPGGRCGRRGGPGAGW